MGVAPLRRRRGARRTSADPSPFDRAGQSPRYATRTSARRRRPKGWLKMVTRCLALAVLTLTACAAVGFAVAAGAWARHRKPAETTVVAAKAEQASASQRTPPAAPPSQPATNVNRKPRGYPESFRRVRPPVSVEVLKRDL